MGSIKKSASFRSVESRLLTQLSKAALVDILIDLMRCNAGEDGELSPETVAELCDPRLAVRGDKLLVIDDYVRTGVYTALARRRSR
jgi:hypoxanthine-guanine phosphoribosyltransferase